MTSTANGRYIPLSVQRRNLLFVVLDGVAIGVLSAGASFVSVLAVRLGASPLWVSLLSSIPAAIRLFMAIPWSGFAERQTRPHAIFAWARAAAHLVYPAVALVLFLPKGEKAAIATVVIWSLSAFPSSLSNMMFTVVMGHAVPPERRAFLMSRRWAFLGIAKLISLPLVSQLIDRMAFPTGYQVVFAANAAVALLAFYCAMRIRVQGRVRSSSSKGDPWLARLRRSIAEVAQVRAFVVFVSGRAMLNLGLALVSAIIPIYWVKHLNVSDTWVGYFIATLSAAMLISYSPWVRIKRKIGTRWTLMASVLGTALYPALLSLTRSPFAVLPVIALNGLAAGGLNLAFFDALLNTCPPDKEERFIAINMTAVNLAGVIAPPIGAALLEILHIRWVMVIGTLAALTGVAVFTLSSPSRQARAGQQEEAA